MAFVNSGWVASTRGDPTWSRGGRSLNAHTLALDVTSYMIPHPEKVARGKATDIQAEWLLTNVSSTTSFCFKAKAAVYSYLVLLCCHAFQIRLVLLLYWHSRDDAENRVRWHGTW